MIYHIPAGTTIHRMKSASKDPEYNEAIVTDKEVYYTDKDLVKIEHERRIEESFRDSRDTLSYIFLLPLSAKPWWSFRVYEDVVHRIEFIGMNTKGPKSERDLLQDLNDGKIDPFKTTPEYQASDSTITAEERIVGRPLTPRERAAIKEQWDDDADQEALDFNVKITKKKLTDSTAQGFRPKPGHLQNLFGNPQYSNAWKNVWARPLLRPSFPTMPQELIDKYKDINRPTDVIEAMAWEIDKEITKDMINGLWGLIPKATPGNIFYLDYVLGSKKKS